MSKSNHIKKVIEELNVFRKYFRVRKEVSDEIQSSIYFIKDYLQTSIENKISCKKRRDICFWLDGDGQKQVLTMNTMKKNIIKNEHNIREYNIFC